MKFSDIKKGYASLNAGLWVAVTSDPLLSDLSLKLRRSHNEDYDVLQAKLLAESSDLSPEANELRVAKECVIQTCLLDWKGVDDPFSADAARVLVADPELGTPFWKVLVTLLNELAAAAKAQLEADTKN